MQRKYLVTKQTRHFQFSIKLQWSYHFFKNTPPSIPHSRRCLYYVRNTTSIPSKSRTVKKTAIFGNKHTLLLHRSCHLRNRKLCKLINLGFNFRNYFIQNIDYMIDKLHTYIYITIKYFNVFYNISLVKCCNLVIGNQHQDLVVHFSDIVCLYISLFYLCLCTKQMLHDSPHFSAYIIFHNFYSFCARFKGFPLFDRRNISLATSAGQSDSS